MDEWEEVLTNNGRQCVDFVSSEEYSKGPYLRIKYAETKQEKRELANEPGTTAYYDYNSKKLVLNRDLNWYDGTELYFGAGVPPVKWHIPASYDYSLFANALHELGHVLGCGEANALARQYDLTGQQYTVMSQEGGGSTSFPAVHWLGWSDAYTIREIWGR